LFGLPESEAIELLKVGFSVSVGGGGSPDWLPHVGPIVLYYSCAIYKELGGEAEPLFILYEELLNRTFSGGR